MKIVDDILMILGLKKVPDHTAPKEPPQRVLIVEDDEALATALNDAFTEAGCKVFLAANGQEGLTRAVNHKPDIILLDLIMPVMNGKAMLRKLREIPEFKRLPVIVLTNAGQIENIRETVVYDNAVEFLVKSNISLDEIVQKVKRTH